MGSKLILFTDGSVNSKKMIGFGAYLVMLESDLLLFSKDTIQERINVKKFRNTTSTKLEMQTLLWALENIENNYKQYDLVNNLKIYTDSQCITGLEKRRERLESRNYKSIGKNKELNNVLFYKKYYSFSDLLKFEIIKVKGHSQNYKKDNIHKIFSYVDKAARNTLRNCLKGSKGSSRE